MQTSTKALCLWILLLCFLWVGRVTAQKNPVPDSILAWRHIEQGGIKLHRRQFKEAQQELEESVKIYTRLGSRNEKSAFAWQLLGRAFFHQAAFDQALEAYTEAAGHYQNVYPPEHPKVIQMHRDRAVIWSSRGNFDQAIAMHLKVMEVELKAPDMCKTQIGHTYNQLGISYLYKEDFANAKAFTEKALAVFSQCKQNDSLFFANPYNTLGACYSASGQYALAIAYYEQAADLFTRFSKSPMNDEILGIYKNLGSTYAGVGNLEKGREYLEKALALSASYYGSASPEVASCYNALGLYFNNLGDFQAGISYLTKALDILRKKDLQDYFFAASVYQNLAVATSNLGDQDRAVRYYLLAGDIYHNVVGTENTYFSTLYHNLAAEFAASEDYPAAIAYHEKAIAAHLQALGDEKHPELAGLYYGAAKSCIQAGGQYARALEYLYKAFDIVQQQYQLDHPDAALVLTGFGEYRRALGDYAEALGYYEKANTLRRKFSGPNAWLAKGYGNIGDMCALIGEYDKADQAYLEGLKIMGYREPEQLDSVASLISVIPLLSARGKLYRQRFLAEGGADRLHLARRLDQEAMKVLSVLHQQLPPASRTIIAPAAAGVTGSAIATNRLLYQQTGDQTYLEDAFLMAERSRAYLLYEAMQESGALKVAGIPDSLLQQENELRIEITFYEKKREEGLASGAGWTDSVVLALSRKLFHLKNRYEALKSRLEAEYPQYYAAKYALPVTGAAEVRKKLLRPGQTLLEYVIADSSIFVFILQAGSMQLLEFKKDFPLEQWVEDMNQKGIYGYYAQPAAARSPLLEEQSRQNYASAAQRLYEKLLAPLKGLITRELIIVPDGVLGYLPFEALLTAAPGKSSNFSTYPFLLYDHQISYGYSATLLQSMQARQHRQAPSKTLLAMAPFYQGDPAAALAEAEAAGLFADTLRSAFSPLPASGPEAASAAKIWKGEVFFDDDATAKRFQEAAGQFRILHLSTHGQADDRSGDYAYLAFSAPGSDSTFVPVYARDLYNMELNADMAVLSACETATGRLRQGEGIISLARAFAYAGAKSIFTSLWKVNDARTKDLLVLFYRKLRSGLPKDAALHEAKRIYLENNRKQGAAGMHPFFWAGFIGIGDMSRL